MLAVGLVQHEQQSSATVVATDRMALGGAHTCVINNDNTVWCWGSNASGQLGVANSVVATRATSPVRSDALPGGRVAVKIAAGASHTCVLAQDGTVWCWGANGSGQVGGTDAVVFQPRSVSLSNQAGMVFAGGENSCAILLDNSLSCWGSNHVGQLGTGPNGVDRNPNPIQVSNIPQSFEVADVAIGRAHMCAISTNNRVWCWGGTANGKQARVPGANVTAPQQLNVGSGTATRVSAGDDHTCVALSTSVSCFGDNSFGQLGVSPFNEENVTPAGTEFGVAVEDVLAGAGFTCVRLRNATPRCWGENSSLQLGAGTSSTVEREIPGVVSGLNSAVVDLVLGASHGCALMGSGEVRCWGNNREGQLGLGNITNRDTATAVNALNVVPTTTTTTTTTTVPPAPSSDTTSSTSSSTSTPTSNTETSPIAVVSESLHIKPVITQLRLRRGRSVSASKIAQAVSMTIPKTSKGKLRISIVRGAQNCVFTNTSIRAVRKGRCTVSVTMVPKNGKTFTRKTTITVN